MENKDIVNTSELLTVEAFENYKASLEQEIVVGAFIFGMALCLVPKAVKAVKNIYGKRKAKKAEKDIVVLEEEDIIDVQ